MVTQLFMAPEMSLPLICEHKLLSLAFFLLNYFLDALASLERYMPVTRHQFFGEIF